MPLSTPRLERTQRHLGHWLALCSWLGVAACSARHGVVPPPEGTAPRRITLLAMTDFHGALLSGGRDRDTQRPFGGAVALSQLVQRARAGHSEPLFLLDGGDEMQGTPESNFTFGRASVGVLNRLGVEAAALGNHEFDWGIDTLRARMRDMRYGMLAANVFEKASGRRPEWIRPYTILEHSGVRVGVIGFATPDTPRVTLPTNVESLRFDPPEKLLPELVRQVRSQGAQVVVVLCHIGAFQDKDGAIRGPLADLAQTADSVDAIIGGHTHSFVAGRVHGIPVVVAASSGRALGRIVLHWNGQRVDSSDVSLSRAFSDSLQVPRDDAVAALVDSMQRQVQPLVSRVVGRAPQPIGGDALANLVTDAMRRAARADVAITNSGGLRRDLEAGPITVRDVFEVLPFENALVTVRLSGAQLRALLEQRADKARLSGLSAHYDPAVPVGQRLTDLQMADGKPLRADASYQVVTNDFMAQGGDGFEGFQQGRDLVITATRLRDVVQQAIEAETQAGRPIVPDPHPRLVRGAAGRP